MINHVIRPLKVYTESLNGIGTCVIGLLWSLWGYVARVYKTHLWVANEGQTISESIIHCAAVPLSSTE